MKLTGTRNTGKDIKLHTERNSFSIGNGDIHVMSYSNKQGNGSHGVGLHTQNYYEVVWLESGSGCHTIDFVKYHFTGPCLFLLHPGNVHCIAYNCPPAGGVMKFSEEFFFRLPDLSNFLIDYDIFDDVNAVPVVNISSIQAEDLRLNFLEIQQAFGDQTRIGREILVMYVKIFLMKIYSFKIGRTNCSYKRSIERDRFNQFRILLEKHYKQRHDVLFFQQTLRLSEKTLRNTTQALAGKSPQVLIQNRVLLEAKRLLFHTSLSVKEIAAQLGFEDPSYFTRFFSIHSGVSPMQFRKDPDA